MTEVSIIGLDLAKSVFQAHGSRADGSVAFRKKLRRSQLLGFFEAQPRCLVAMEACATSHYWAREIAALGHDVRLIPPQYVKPYVKRQKNDMADAEAIAEAASRANMRFVAVKSAERQVEGMSFKTRGLFVRQRTQLINALRGHLAEHGMVAPLGAAQVARLAELWRTSETGLPQGMAALCETMLTQIETLTAEIERLDAALKRRAQSDDTARRLMTVPGVGPIIASALIAFAPPPELFRKGRDFSAWMGLTPKQNSSGGKQRLGRISKEGQSELRRLLIIGASSLVRQAACKGAPGRAATGAPAPQTQQTDRLRAWLDKLLERRPRMLAIVALANRIARIVWAMMRSGEAYRASAAAA